MPIYEYETIPGKKGRRVRRFEIQQGMMDAPLEKDPETGERIRRVITGGLEIPRGSSNSTEPHRSNAGGGSCSCC